MSDGLTNGRRIVEELYAETPNGPRLVVSRCIRCGSLAFPSSVWCRDPECGATEADSTLIGPVGQVWSYTVQHYSPPPPFQAPDPFEPYAIALVEFPEGIRIAGIVAGDPDRVQVGAVATLILEPVRREVAPERNGLTWKFQVGTAGDPT